jgi:hypothetical protein
MNESYSFNKSFQTSDNNLSTGKCLRLMDHPLFHFGGKEGAGGEVNHQRSCHQHYLEGIPH